LESITKSKLSYDKINKLVKQAFGSSIKADEIIELTDGFFNTAYMLTLNQGLKTVLKVSPPRDVLVMSYEKNIMEAEVYVLNKIKELGDIPSPKVYYYDKSGEIIENEFFFMEYIYGVPLEKIHSALSEEQKRQVSVELGTHVKKMHNIEGSYFGFISQEYKRFHTWDEAFLFMVREILEDGRKAGSVLPYDYDKIYNLVYEKRDVLEAVKKPCLVHKDLWMGNIFINPDSANITGIVDCERALYGDTLLELVCGFLLGDENFIKSYRGEVTFEKDEEVRIALYKIYLYLLMIIECSYRHYPDDGLYKWASAELVKVLGELEML
jgi:aminoglycoside phosphotransferase (APT) family kinase protein